MMAGYIDMPLTKVPDPFGTALSYGMHNNLRLQAFLDGLALSMNLKVQPNAMQMAILTRP